MEQDDTRRTDIRASVLPVIAGLAVSQAVSFFWVRGSNLALLQTASVLESQGYVAAPGAHILPSLQGFSAAFWGGLFFTLTIGAALSLATLVLARAWLAVGGKKPATVIAAVLWLLALVWVNLGGFVFFPSLYFLLVPPVVAGAVVKLSKTKRDWAHGLIFFVPLVLLTILWGFQYSKDLFDEVRDDLLLQSRTGQAINDWYYRYTLFPAEVFKALDQKQVRTARLGRFRDPETGETLRRALVYFDYLPVTAEGPVHLEVSERAGRLVLAHGGREVLDVSLREFLENPEKYLKDFSRKSDNFARFRLAVFISLLLGFSVLLYFCVFAVLEGAAGLVLKGRARALAAALLCLAVGLWLIAPFFTAGRLAKSPKSVEELLSCRSVLERVSGLKKVFERQMDIRAMPQYASLQKSPHVVERRWLAKALVYAGGREAYQDLLAFLNDPNPNVRCLAMRSLALRREGASVAPILARLRASREWYEQWYAYESLKRLGWRQDA